MRRVTALAFAALALCACGRRATRADCEHLFDRNIEVKMRSDGVVDPPSIQKKQAELRTKHQEDIDKCVGRRINDSMLKCADSAETAKDIDKCIR